MTDDKFTFTFASGVQVALQLVNPVFIGKVAQAAVNKYSADHEIPPVPHYEVALAGGGKESQELTEETITLEPWKDDPELQAEWQAYESAREALATERITATAKAYCVKGVKENPPDEWVEDQAYWGIELPDDARDVKWEWVQALAQNGWGEIIDLVMAVQGLPNPTEEAAQAAEASFRDSMGAPDDGEDAGADTDEAIADQSE